MEELTIKQIKAKQNQLEKEVKKLLNDFNQSTGLEVTCSVNYGHTTKYEQYVNFKYSNPFCKV